MENLYIELPEAVKLEIDIKSTEYTNEISDRILSENKDSKSIIIAFKNALYLSKKSSDEELYSEVTKLNAEIGLLHEVIQRKAKNG